jgi:inhibitor of KinA
MQFNQLLLGQPFAGMIETVPAYCTLTVFYDVATVKKGGATGQTASAKVQQYLQALLHTAVKEERPELRLVKIPVCYDDAFAPDMAAMSTAKNLSAQQIIQLHTASPFRVYMIGFMPGFAYMGIVPEALQAPRLAVPRTQVTAGSVGITGAQTGIYPFASPGGWNIIGQTPLKLFDAQRPQPCLLQVGDSVQFYAIDAAAFHHLKQQQP